METITPLTIRNIRRMRDVTMHEIADKLGVCTATYSKYEKNPETMPIEMAKAVCAILGASVEQIFFGSDLSYTQVGQKGPTHDTQSEQD